MPFQFPDPSIQSSIVHPVTGETWEYINGAWESISNIDDHEDEDHQEAFAAKSIEAEVEENEETIEVVMAALLQAKADIIELRSKVDSLELTSFLILE
jgi:hypothetical protein